MALTLKNLEICFESAKKLNAKYVALLIKIADNEYPEIIINERANFDFKLSYYKEAYNNDLTLKSYDKIKILGFTYANSFSAIEEDLIY